VSALRRLALVMLLLALSPVTTRAAEATTLAADPALESQVMRIADELRCLVCQNETIAASQAELAIDLRRQIRSKLQQGESPTHILDFMVQRYGEFVRYRPALNATTALLWIGPFALLVVAGLVLALTVRRQRGAAGQDALDEEESRQLAELLRRAGAQP
jgi:cytochrome c-type biogenesis protein CcmH